MAAESHARDGDVPVAPMMTLGYREAERERAIRNVRDRLALLDGEGVRDLGARAAERATERRELVERLRELQQLGVRLGCPPAPAT